jgi:hypothetical protein
MSTIFPTPEGVRRVLAQIDCLRDSFNEENTIGPTLFCYKIAEPSRSQLAEDAQVHLHGDTFIHHDLYQRKWLHRSECLRALEFELNPAGHPLNSPLRYGRFITEAVGWHDATGCPQAFRDLFEAQDGLLRLYESELMPETGYIRDPSIPLLSPVGISITVDEYDPATGERVTNSVPNPLQPFDVLQPPPRMELWIQERLDRAAARLRLVLDRGFTEQPAPDPFAPLRALVTSLRLKGNEAESVIAICDGNGRARVADLAVRFDWSNQVEGWNNTRKRLKEKFRGHGWTFATESGNAVARQIRVRGE